MKEGRRPRAPLSLLILLVLTMLAGCQDIFTFAPLKGLQRDPSTLSPEQRLVYGQDALASGDKGAMLAAYDALKTDTSVDAVHLTAELGIELSGVPGLLNDAVTDESKLTGSGTTLQDYIDTHAGVDPLLIIAAGQSMRALDMAGYPLSTNDRLLGAIGLALEASQSQGYDLGAVGVDLTDARALIAPLVGTDSFADKMDTYFQSP